jgi:flagellar biosynthetic protein FlhB
VPEEFGQERTERATPRRREEARREGRVARSLEVGHAAVLLALTAALALGGGAFVRGCRDLLVGFLGNLGGLDLSVAALQELQPRLWTAFFGLVAPVALVSLLAGTGASVLQVGFHASARPLAPRAQRINPAMGFKRLVSLDALFETTKAFVKLVLVGFVSWAVVRSAVSALLPAQGSPAGVVVTEVGHQLVVLGLRVGLLLLVLAILDYGYQRWRYEKDLRMSRREMEEELRQQEGSPHVKSRLRALQRQLSRRRMMAEVPRADVVVTNPVHVAVALRYERGRMEAPTVVAKGARKLAERIKDLARRHRVPVVEDPPLARALYRQVEVGQVIPVELYEAVARVLAYVYRLHQAAQGA